MLVLVLMLLVASMHNKDYKGAFVIFVERTGFGGSKQCAKHTYV